jgi:hypothetical protein
MAPDPAAVLGSLGKRGSERALADPSEQAKAVLYRMRDATFASAACSSRTADTRFAELVATRCPGERKGSAVQFGAVLGGDPLTTAREMRLLEERGFSAVWFPHVPTIGWGDPYICMAQAAAASTRILSGHLSFRLACAPSRMCSPQSRR